ncbi:hypothetical protein [Ancylobacter lacus]|uniref:hypothetical protein n=1 Tax=Ancylobacter lacus TaxID=2579970 RepID=UPI001BCC261D|nr:hypothetical protein [Ancylobacter lacus]MBS7538759.1 hypothetical protein [Ancylobacter lacus]
MSDAFKDWETDGQGHLKVWPLFGFTTALFGQEAAGLRLEIGTTAPKPGEPIPALQLVLKPDQVRQLADALAEVAERLETLTSLAGRA